MIAKFSVVAVLSFSVAAFPMQQARAQDGIVGGIIGGIIGGAIANGQRSSQPQRVVRSSGVSSAQREQNRSVQTALNHFGWNVGGADGVLGRRSREGISQYQVFCRLFRNRHAKRFRTQYSFDRPSARHHGRTAGGADSV